MDRPALLDLMAAALTEHFKGIKAYAADPLDLLTEDTQWRLEGWVEKRPAMSAILDAMSEHLHVKTVRVEEGEPVADGEISLDAIRKVKNLPVMQIVDNEPHLTAFPLWRRLDDMDYRCRRYGLQVVQDGSAWSLRDAAGELGSFDFTDRDSREEARNRAFKHGETIGAGAEADMAADGVQPAAAMRQMTPTFYQFWESFPRESVPYPQWGMLGAIPETDSRHLARALSAYLSLRLPSEGR